MSKFSPGKLMTAFFVFFFPILIYLGSWQVIRGLEKKDIVDQHYQNKSLPVINESDMPLIEEDKLTYRTINLQGEFGPESYLLDNRLYRQKAGYEVFTTFRRISRCFRANLEACRPETFKALWLCPSVVWSSGSFN
jgi:surfeit locus 1 family protein